jgi:hypothetical protein
MLDCVGTLPTPGTLRVLPYGQKVYDERVSVYASLLATKSFVEFIGPPQFSETCKA